MPTYNAEQYLERCILSIKTTSVSSNYEILVADGGSNDETLNILKKHNISVVKNPKRIAEYGKYLAYKKAHGEYLVFIDADNIISSENWLENMLVPFKKNPDLIGVESNYKIHDDFSSLNAYLAMLIIVDPYARMLSTRPRTLKFDGYSIKIFNKGSSPVSGANGFIWQKSYIDNFLSSYPMETLEESTILNYIASTQEVRIGNVKDVGIYHYYADNIADYIKKRRKIANKFLDRRKSKVTWVDTRTSALKVFSALYLVTLIGPTAEAVYNMFRTKRIEWLWHPVTCWITVVTYAYYLLKDKFLNERTT